MIKVVVQAEFLADAVLAGSIDNHNTDIKTIKEMEVFSPNLLTIQGILEPINMTDFNIAHSKTDFGWSGVYLLLG
jgi:hypothetical protein